jgi:hypothetical protein
VVAFMTTVELHSTVVTRHFFSHHFKQNTMKPFKEMNSIDKGKLLHQLFPDDINHLLTFIEDSANMIINDPALMPETWNRNIQLIDWLEQADDTKEKIKQHREQMVKSSHFFASTLFKGYLDFFPVQCLKDYTLLTPNQKVADAIEFLFEL